MKKFLDGKSSGILEGLVAYNEAFEKLTQEGYIPLFGEDELSIYCKGEIAPVFEMELEGGKVVYCKDEKLKSILREV